ncbi:MAG: winged helix-turn-helix domain-containing protein [Candidatus Bathyarchaeia archaeon]|nr:winged helix-turn-helix domain-containing protein [Candidatus Bathyarchaeia archaeon]
MEGFIREEFSLALSPNREKYKTSKFLNFNKKYRSHFEIIALIIETIKSRGVAQHSVMRHANINYMQLKKYLGSLAEMDFIEVKRENSSILYKATEKGLAFLRQYYVLLGMLLGTCSRDNQLTSLVKLNMRCTDKSACHHVMRQNL